MFCRRIDLAHLKSTAPPQGQQNLQEAPGGSGFRLQLCLGLSRNVKAVGLLEGNGGRRLLQATRHETLLRTGGKPAQEENPELNLSEARSVRATINHCGFSLIVASAGSETPPPGSVEMQKYTAPWVRRVRGTQEEEEEEGGGRRSGWAVWLSNSSERPGQRPPFTQFWSSLIG